MSDETTIPRRKKRWPKPGQGKYNATRKVVLRLSVKQYESLLIDSFEADTSMNEFLLGRLFPEGSELHKDHLPRQATPVAGGVE